MKLLKYTLWLCFIILFGCASTPQYKYKDSPIVGSWVYSVEGCDETYQFLPSGIRVGTSNKEIFKAKYEFEVVSPERGIYKLRDEVIEDNGLEDCSGSAADMTGDIVEVYVVLSKNPDKFIFCLDKGLETCVGPFIKKE